MRLAQDNDVGIISIEIARSPINSVEDLLGDPHLTAVGFAKAIDHPTEGKILSISPPVSFSLTPCCAELPAPPQK